MALIYMVKEEECDCFVKNKFGYTPFDIAQNYEIQQLIEKLLNINNSIEENKRSTYGRTAYNGVLRHNDRVTSV